MNGDFKPRGIIPAMVTPLDDEGNIDEASLRHLVDYLISGGVHGLLVAGSQGEAYALTPKEKEEILKIVVDEARGRVPVYAGTGAITTRETIALSRMAEELRADAVLVITPYFISPSNAELYNHYLAVANATHLPIILYTNPARTGVNLDVDLVAKLSKADNIVGIKDSSGDLSQTMEYIRRCGDDFSVLAGRDTLIYATLQCGGTGAISATANVVPGLVVEIYEAFMAGDFEKSLTAQYRLAPLRQAFSMGTFPVVVKEALALMGMCSARAIAPVGPLAEDKRQKLKGILKELGAL
ncbi:MAG TPA: 4-hydroxy-tetrahydrodipicolinate synthase [Anaerolineae bacterium]|nr:4-hydroxy-tetrahydrodipicolinate synthase [Anaerolineae bacterium]